MTTTTTARSVTTMIGEFDSFHVGHRNLMCAAKRIAERHHTPLNALVLYDEVATSVTTVDQRIERLVDAGADSVTVLEASFADAEATIVHAIGEAEAHVAVMACAPNRPTDLKWPNVRTILRRLSVEIVEVERSIDAHGTPITSDLVRRHLAAGDVSRVTGLLGTTFTVSGLVRHGDARGRTIGFPTANLPQDSTTLWPAFGVYGAWVEVGSERHIAAVNVGTRPTVYGTSGVPLLEAHLLDFSGDLYDRQIEVHFVERIRGEQRFDSLAALTARLATDVDVTRRLVSIPAD
jgi:riboflavin kinase/FMN adenylyltransferase